MGYEYKVVAMPEQAAKTAGLRGKANQFAQTVNNMMNAVGREGWEYQGLEVLSYQSRTWYGSKTNHDHTVMLFRRPLEVASSAAALVDAKVQMIELRAEPLVASKSPVASGPEDQETKFTVPTVKAPV
ncbi:MAG: hypothetical protein ACI9O0_000861 [Paracoccaceae bacterium]|jgi:hypothetical protein